MGAATILGLEMKRLAGAQATGQEDVIDYVKDGRYFSGI